VIESLRDHAGGRRPRVSTAWITDGHGREEPYTMIIEKRKKRKKRGGRAAGGGVHRVRRERPGH